MLPVAAIVSAFIAIAGGFYLFNVGSAQQLMAIEGDQNNAYRMRLRRCNGAVMLVMAVVIYAGMHALDNNALRGGMAAAWLLTIAILIGVVVVLALVDLRLTAKLRSKNRSL